MELRSSRKTTSPTSPRVHTARSSLASQSVETSSTSSASPGPTSHSTNQRTRSAQPAASKSAAIPNANVVPTAASQRTPRKRKAPSRNVPTEPEASPSQPRKRARVSASSQTSPTRNTNTSKGRNKAATAESETMADQPSSSGQHDESWQNSALAKKRRSKKTKATPPSTPGSSTKSKKPLSEPDVSMKDADEQEQEEQSEDHDDHDEEMADATRDSEEEGEGEGHHEEDYDRDDDDDVFDGSYLGSLGPGGISGTLRALSGMMGGGYSTRFRDILAHLRQKEDPSLQLIALQNLAEILLVSTEENLSGHFSPDQFIKELVSLMQGPSPYGDENPEIMLLACRCIANMMEALPACTANVVYGGAVPVLCEKLLEIAYIDLAEQALSTLEKISIEFPTSIVREGGLAACLNFLDFFATNVQRTAVTTAANCCRSIPADCFETVRDVMPILLNVLRSSDQRVVEQGCLCIARIAESYKNRPEKLEQLMTKDVLQAVLSLLLPGTTNLIGSHIHTQFLKVLSITARASPTLSAELFKMNIVDTLHQILTGVSAPTDNDVTSLRNDSVMTMQALIHRPKEQVFETLNVICELLPGVPHSNAFDEEYHEPAEVTAIKERRLQLLQDCKDKLRQFAIVLLPTLTDAYASTVNLNVRQKVLDAQLKMISNLDVDILQEALQNVQFASYLATILSQKDHPTLVYSALQAAELLLSRIPDVYKYHFHREGVFAEISKLQGEEKEKLENATTASEEDRHSEDDDDRMSDSSGDSRSSTSSRNMPRQAGAEIADYIAVRAKNFMELIEKDDSDSTRDKAVGILHDLKALAQELEDTKDPAGVFKKMAAYFHSTTSLSSISSFELLNSGIVETLLSVLTEGTEERLEETRKAFVTEFMRPVDAEGHLSSSPFSVLVQKLQDLLSRSENFEVVTVHHNSYDGNRSSATSMLAKQLRLRLVADEDSDVPRAYRQIMVSIHAIATFKALDDYLRPRISLPDKPRNVRRENLAAPGSSSSAAAAAAAMATLGNSPNMQSALAAFAAATGLHGAQGNSSTSSRTLGPSDAAGDSKKNSEDKRSSRLKKFLDNPNESGKASKEAASPSANQSNLQCAEEHSNSEQDDDMEGELEGMDSVLDDLEEDMDDESVTDNDPVNLEMEKSGHVTARGDDGTRVATPSNAVPTQSSSSRPSWLAQAMAASASRPSTYANALHSIPQDWHIEFSVGDQVISNDTTIYKAVMQSSRNASGETNYRNLWSTVQNVKFRKAPGPPPPSSPISPPVDENAEPTSIEKNKTSSTILHLLSVLHELNANLDDIFATDPDLKPAHKEPLSQFVNTKLTAKLNRQLEEPLIVASACLPAWSEDLARLYPFLFPFETRHLFLQSTSFGYSRSMNRWQSSQSSSDNRDRRDDNRPFLGRLQRQKVRISRSRILESAIKVMELYGASPSILEVEYFEEVGTGLGPTLEFYSSVSKAFAQKKLKLWRENESPEDSEFAFGQQGLFPAPFSEKAAGTEAGKKILSLFSILGKFVARSMLDSRIVDISFNPTFFRACVSSNSTVAPSLGSVKNVDKNLYKSLLLLRKFEAEKEKIEKAGYSTAEKLRRLCNVEIDGVAVDDLALDFTLPGYPDFELIPGGADINVTIFNVGEYIDKVIDATLGSGVKKQTEAFKAGFSQVFPFSALRAFTPDELVMLFGQVEEDWSIETLTDSIKADHGFNMDSKSVRNLLQVMSEFNTRERRDFLQFVTGSPKLPIGGFKSLTPMLTVVCKASEPPLAPDDYLPSVMTCVNYLKLPDYTNLDVMRERLKKAIKEGQGAFHLS